MNDEIIIKSETNEESSMQISIQSRPTARPLVSISMITYNHEKYIEEAINGVLMQETDFDVELIIANDDSPDQTDTIIQRILKEHPKAHWIKYIKNKKNIGMRPNGNANLQRCTGEYIAICEGDDYWIDSKKLQFQIDEMKKHPECDMSFHPAEIRSGMLKTTEITAFHSTENRIFTTSEIIKGDGTFCPTASLLIKRSVLDNLPDFYYSAPVGDYFIQVLGSVNGGALYLNRVMSAYRVNISGSWTSNNNDITKKKLFFENFIRSLNDLNYYLNMTYQSEIHFMIEQQYYYMSLYYLENRLNEDYDNLFRQYFQQYPKTSIRIKTLYIIGSSIRNPIISHKIDNIIFNVFNETPFIIRLYRKIINSSMFK